MHHDTSPLRRALLAAALAAVAGLAACGDDSGSPEGGGEPVKIGVNVELSGPPVDVLGLAFSRQSLWIIGSAVAVAALLWLFLAHSVPGKAMRACAMNRDAARLQGISPSRMSLYAFALAAAVAGAAGFVFVPVTHAHYEMGLFLAINGFTAAVIGGLASPLGAVAGGFLLGALEALAAGLVSSGYESIVAFGLLFVVLVARPRGVAARAA